MGFYFVCYELLCRVLTLQMTHERKVLQVYNPLSGIPKFKGTENPKVVFFFFFFNTLSAEPALPHLEAKSQLNSHEATYSLYICNLVSIFIHFTPGFNGMLKYTQL